MNASPRDGFSLLEVMISLAVLSVVIALTAPVLQGLISLGSAQVAEPMRLRAREQALTLPFHDPAAPVVLHWREDVENEGGVSGFDHGLDLP